ncbi:MAG: hypothetical protein MAG453_01403 [Calditrichaeota bacterium]|nr:hypothetical protein [Calditrichota bacterium]
MLAKVVTGILTGLVIIYLVGEGINFLALSQDEVMMLITLLVMLVGLWVGMVRDLIGGLISFTGFLAMVKLQGGFDIGWVFFLFAVNALMYVGNGLYINLRNASVED